MKTGTFWVVAILIIAAAIGGYFWWSKANSQTANSVCAKTNTSYKMTFSEARDIASGSECVKQGALKDYHWCNEGTGTWWIDLNINRQGCSPACVIDVEKKTAEINWMCTGLSQ
jgi:hypothetical protein